MTIDEGEFTSKKTHQIYYPLNQRFSGNHTGSNGIYQDGALFC